MADDGQPAKMTTDDTVNEALPHRSPAMNTPTDSTAHPNPPESGHENEQDHFAVADAKYITSDITEAPGGERPRRTIHGDTRALTTYQTGKETKPEQTCQPRINTESTYHRHFLRNLNGDIEIGHFGHQWTNLPSAHGHAGRLRPST